MCSSEGSDAKLRFRPPSELGENPDLGDVHHVWAALGGCGEPAHPLPRAFGRFWGLWHGLHICLYPRKDSALYGAEVNRSPDLEWNSDQAASVLGQREHFCGRQDLGW